jgi:chromosomal replication initiator protein
VNNNNPSFTDLELLTSLLREEIEATGDMKKAEMSFLFDDIYIKSVENSVAKIAVPTLYMREYYIRNKIDEKIQKHLSHMLGMDISVEIFVDDKIYPKPEMRVFGYLGNDEEKVAEKTVPEEMKMGFIRPVSDENGKTTVQFISAKKIADDADAEPVNYKEDYTFENFIVGDSNKVAHAFAQTVAEHPGDRKHNPMYIYGPPGVGKTHLMYAITNKVLEKEPDKRIEYIKGEDFVNLFVEMIRDNRGLEFREKYRGADMLIIDDVQFIAGKPSTEEELFHTFNSLFEENKQIVFTADKLPREMPGISQRLESRLEGGVMADIQLPEYELRLAILQSKAEASGLNLTDEVEDYLAKRLTSSIRQIEGVVKKLSGMTFVSDDDLTVESVRQMVPEYLSDAVPTDDIVKNVIKSCAEYYNVKPEDLLGERRDLEIKQARNVAMYIIRNITNLSTVKIGDIFKRKYTTVLSNCKTVSAQIEEKPSFQAEIEQMIRNSRV